MKRINYFIFLLFFSIGGLFLSLTKSFSQNKSESSIILSVETTTISLNEPLIINLSFPSNFKKEYKAAQSIIFPDIPDMEKGQTLYESEKQLKISQWYWPRKSGVFSTPQINFKIRDYEVSRRKTIITVKASKSNFTYEKPNLDLPWVESDPALELLWMYPKTPLFERQQFNLELSLLVPVNNREEWNFVDIKEQIQDLTKKIGATGLLIHTQLNSEIPLDSFEKDQTKYYKYTIYKGTALSLDTALLKIPPLNFHYITYKTQTVTSGILFSHLSKVNRVAVNKELTTRAVTLNFKPLPEHPLKNEVAVGIFSLHASNLKQNQRTTGFNFNFEISGPIYPLPLHQPWQSHTIPGLHIHMKNQSVSQTEENQRTSFNYFMYSDTPKSLNLKGSLLWVYFNLNKNDYDTLFINQEIEMKNAVDEDKETNSEDSFEQMMHKASNTPYSLEKDESLNRFANLIIFILFLAISVLIFKR